MAKSRLVIRQSKSLEEFLTWWQGPEVTEFCERHPNKMSELGNHHWVKPWLDEFRNQNTIRQAENMTQPTPSGTTAGKFGKYQLIKKLGQGGMGVVYLAQEPLSKRNVTSA